MSFESPQSTFCAIYTRKSSEEGLDQQFNSLDAQREACEAFVLSQRHEGWRALRTRYDDPGYSGGTMDRPALKHLLADIEAGKVNTVVVYKVDRLTRSLGDFAKIIETFDQQKVSFVSITQQFNTTTSMGRLTLNVLLSFAQFEREVTGERIRDKIAASKRKGMWMGGNVPLGYVARARKLVVDPAEAKRVRWLFGRYLALGCVRKLKTDLDQRGFRSKIRKSGNGRASGGAAYSRGALYRILQNPIYLGEIHHKGQVHKGEHQPIVSRKLWDKVQRRLRSNNQARRSGINVKSPSLLAGLIFDGTGCRMTPSHAVKNGKRYRYYVSQKEGGLRVPAYEVEGLVSNQVRGLLGAPDRLAGAFATSHGGVNLKALLATARRRLVGWDEVGTASQVFLRSAVQRVTIGDAKVEVVVSKRRFVEGLLGQNAMFRVKGGALLVLASPAKFARSGSELRLVVSSDTQTRRLSQSLIRAVIRAREWYEQLVSGESDGGAALARDERVTPRYLWRILEGAFLAPDIVERILNGRQPPGLSIERFRGRFPMDWREQRMLLGLPDGPLP